MKKILTVLLTLAVSIGCVLGMSACTPSQSVNKIINVKSHEVVVYNDAKELSEFENWSNADSEGDLICFFNGNYTEPQYKIFNIKTGTTIVTTSGTVTLEENQDRVWVLVTEEIEGKDITTLYDVEGKKIVSGELDYYENGLDLIVFNNEVYRVNANKIEKALDMSEMSFVDVSDLNVSSKDYYYIKGLDSVTVYDKNLKYVNFFRIPSFAEDATINVMENGKVFVQYLVEKDMLSTDYDIMEGGDKYSLVSEIFNPKDGKTEKVKLDVIVKMMLAKNVEIDGMGIGEIFGEKAENIVMAYDIVDKKIDNLGSDAKLYHLTNKGKIEEIETGVSDMMAFEPLENGYIYVINNAGLSFLVNPEGKVVGEVSEVDHSTTKYIITESSIYDYNLNKLLDCKKEGYEFYEVLSNNVVLRKEVESVYKYYLFNGEIKELDGSFTSENDYFFVMNKDSKYYVYNENGELFFENASLYDTYSVIFDYNDTACVVKVGDKYFRFAHK